MKKAKKVQKESDRNGSKTNGHSLDGMSSCVVLKSVHLSMCFRLHVSHVANAVFAAAVRTVMPGRKVSWCFNNLTLIGDREKEDVAIYEMAPFWRLQPSHFSPLLHDRFTFQMPAGTQGLKGGGGWQCKGGILREGWFDQAAGGPSSTPPPPPSLFRSSLPRLSSSERGIKVTECNHCLLSANEENG